MAFQRKWIIGLTLILAVALIWAVSSIVVQFMYEDLDFKSPFYLTYVSCGLFVLYLPLWSTLSYAGFIQARTLPSRKFVDFSTLYSDITAVLRHRTDGASIDDYASSSRSHLPEFEMVHGDELDADTEMDGTGNAVSGCGSGKFGEEEDAEVVEVVINQLLRAEGIRGNSSGGDSTSATGSVRSILGRDATQLSNSLAYQSSGNASDAHRSSHGTTDSFRSTSFSDSRAALVASIDVDGCSSGRVIITGADDDGAGVPSQLISHLQHLYIALFIAPVWFLANFAYYYSLLRTSISSSTILSNLSGLFTLLFSVWMGMESVTAGKMLGLLACFAGVVVITLHDRRAATGDASGAGIMYNSTLTGDPDDGSSNTTDITAGVDGDIFAIIGAVGYGLYASTIKRLVPSEEHISMQLVLGYIGLVNLVFFTPVALLLWAVDPSVLSSMSWPVLGLLCGTAIFDDVISDYLWGCAVVLTSATVATVGMSITIPLALLTDAILHPETTMPTIASYAGAALVVAGFVCVNVFHK